MLRVEVVLVLSLLVGSPHGPHHLESFPPVCVLDELVHLLVTAIFVVQLALHLPVLACNRHPVLHGEPSPLRVVFEQGLEGCTEYYGPLEVRQDGKLFHWPVLSLSWHLD